jgi:hypothetical protein
MADSVTEIDLDSVIDRLLEGELALLFRRLWIPRDWAVGGDGLLWGYKVAMERLQRKKT